MSLLPFGFVAIKEEVYLKIAEAVLTYANPFKMMPQDFKEVYGFLGGRVVIGNLKINEVKVAHVGGNTEVQLGAKHMIEAADWESSLYLKEPSEFMVGWFHSHFIGHTFSGVDVLNHLGWQNANNPHAIGLVFDPQLLSEKNPGFVILKLEDYNKGEASEVQSIDYVIQMKEKYRDNYLKYLQIKLPQLFY
ncbi:MAG: hypothetical protein ACTSR8_17670 [Promethearchaeota archaeon]